MAALLQARVEPALLRVLEQHIARCSACRELLSAMAHIATSPMPQLGGEPAADSGDDAGLASSGPDRKRPELSEPAASGVLDDDVVTHRGATDAGLSAGDVLGRFVLTRPLGHGSMGEVWSAHDQELDREVALKLLRLRGGALGVEATVRLRREAQAMARLNHPNVVTIYELGADRERVFCAMELVDGVTLRRWLATPRPWREVIAVASAIARGIAAAHAVGLIHRDIKPENMLIASDGRALISDFGLAKLADLGTGTDEADRGSGPGKIATTSSIAALTATGAMIGTPLYMSPEQLDGNQADARSDQFGYCVTVHEALFGVRPFAGDTIDELAEDIRRGPQPLRRRGAVPTGVVRCLTRGLGADPAARWPSMTALVHELERAARRPQQRRKAALLGGVAAAAIAAALVVARTPDPVDAATRAAEHRIAAVWNPEKKLILQARFLATGTALALERAETTTRLLDAYRAAWLTQRLDAWSATQLRGEQTTEVLERRLACFDQLAGAMDGLVSLFLSADAHDVVEAPQSVYRLEPIASCGNLDRLLPRSIPASTPAGILAERQLNELEAVHRAGRHAEALQRAPSLLEPAMRLGDPVVLARARFDLGAVQATAGRFGDAETTLRLALQEAAAVRNHYLVAECWLRLLNVTGYGLLHRDAAAAIEPAARAAVAQAGNDPHQLADLAKTLGLVAASLGDAAAARVHFEEARDRHITARGANDPAVGTDEANLGAALMDLGHLDEATGHFERAIAILSDTLGKHHPAIAGVEHNLALIAAERKDWAAAERHARAAVAMNLLVSGSEYQGTAINRTELADILREQKRFAETRSELELARSSLVQTLPATHPSVILFDIHVAQLDEAEGHWDSAVQLARRVVDAMQHSEVPARNRVWAISQLGGMVAHRAPREGLAICEEALRLLAEQPGGPRLDDTEPLKRFAELALRMHQPEAALRWFDRMPDVARRLADVRGQLERASATRR